MAVTRDTVTSFECKQLDANNVTEATAEYELLINRHMNDPRSKYKDGKQLYMMPVQYGMKKIGDTFVVEITFIGATNKSKLRKQV